MQQSELLDPLTEREIEILRLLANGWSDSKIAHDLVLSLNTVKWYNKRIYSKLGVENRTQAVRQAKELGLLGGIQPLVAKPRHNLPAATTPFIGREAELANLIELLSSPDVRLVTLLAAGGMGKTRMAMETARALLNQLPHGAFFVPLVQLRSVDNIVPTIASVLNIQLQSMGDPINHVMNYLHDKKMLLILDNFEHLLDGAGIINSLLENAPSIKIIVTSRERLNLRGETVYALGGMLLPTEKSREEILKCSAIQLFLQRSQMNQANLVFSDEELPWVAQICQQVWGMPLGIELAASLVDILSLEEIASEIATNYDILSTDMRDIPQRQQSIRAIFDYSWLRLTDTEQTIYMQLAAFRGGFTREAAKEIVGADLRILAQLANKSLLQRETESGRYIIHELLRQYAEAKLNLSGQADRLYEAHMRYYSQRLSDLGEQIKGSQQLEGLNQIETDFENFRDAWQWAINISDHDAINRSLEAMYWFCLIRARVPDGEMIFKQARQHFGISYDENAHPLQRRLVLRFDAAGEDYREQIEGMLELARKTGSQHDIAFFLWMLGVNCYVSGDFERAINVITEARALFAALNDNFYMIECLHLLWVCKRFTGQKAEAKDLALQIRDLSRLTGNRYALGRALGSQGMIAIFDDNDEKAAEDLQEAINIRVQLGDSSGLAVSLMSLSHIAFFNGDLIHARNLAEESLTLATETSSLFPKTLALGILSWLSSIEEDYSTAWDLCYNSIPLEPDPNVTFTLLIGISMAACGREDYTTASSYMQRLLQTRSPRHTERGLSTCLPAMALIHASQGNFEQAAEVLAFAAVHPLKVSRWMKQWPLIGRLQTHLKSALTPETFDAAWERGTQLNLNAIISAWLETNT